jgi:hypothetical protein
MPSGARLLRQGCPGSPGRRLLRWYLQAVRRSVDTGRGIGDVCIRQIERATVRADFAGEDRRVSPGSSRDTLFTDVTFLTLFTPIPFSPFGPWAPDAPLGPRQGTSTNQQVDSAGRLPDEAEVLRPVAHLRLGRGPRGPLELARPEIEAGGEAEAQAGTDEDDEDDQQPSHLTLRHRSADYPGSTASSAQDGAVMSAGSSGRVEGMAVGLAEPTPGSPRVHRPAHLAPLDPDPVVADRRFAVVRAHEQLFELLEGRRHVDARRGGPEGGLEVSGMLDRPFHDDEATRPRTR